MSETDTRTPWSWCCCRRRSTTTLAGGLAEVFLAEEHRLRSVVFHMYCYCSVDVTGFSLIGCWDICCCCCCTYVCTYVRTYACGTFPPLAEKEEEAMWRMEEEKSSSSPPQLSCCCFWKRTCMYEYRQGRNLLSWNKMCTQLYISTLFQAAEFPRKRSFFDTPEIHPVNWLHEPAAAGLLERKHSFFRLEVFFSKATCMSHMPIIITM